MKYIAPLAVASIIVLHWVDAFPHSSVGGSMMIALAFLVAALVVGLHEAWSHKRGVFGWIVSMVIAVIGAIVATMLGASVFDVILPHFKIEGSLTATRHPLLYVMAAAMMLMSLFGAWCALRLVNRWR